MTAAELRAARILLLALHEQADRNSRLRPRIAAFRTALACVELVQQAAMPHPPVQAAPMVRAQRQRFAPTQAMQLPSYEPTTWGRPGFAPTLPTTLPQPLGSQR